RTRWDSGTARRCRRPRQSARSRPPRREATWGTHHVGDRAGREFLHGSPRRRVSPHLRTHHRGAPTGPWLAAPTRDPMTNGAIVDPMPTTRTHAAADPVTATARFSPLPHLLITAIPPAAIITVL